ncbi:hypothetical protein [Dokdonia sp.]|uniref:hypothetical protein n=1 Tax=Dokdonia sp. TaxID=2024995 RepID=UPI00326730CE
MKNSKNKIDPDFSKSIGAILNTLYKFSKKASFQIGFGTLTLGLIFLYLDKQPLIIKTIIGFGGFFISARIGQILDQFIKSKLKN